MSALGIGYNFARVERDLEESGSCSNIGRSSEVREVEDTLKNGNNRIRGERSDRRIPFLSRLPRRKKYGVWKAGYGSITIFLSLEPVNDHDEQ